MRPLTRYDDLESLRRKRFRIPELFHHGAWLVCPYVQQPADMSLGPASTQLLLWLPVSGEAPELGQVRVPAQAASADPAIVTWQHVVDTIGAPRGPIERSLPAAAIEVLIPGGKGFTYTTEERQCIVRGTEYATDAFGSIFWQDGWAIGTGSGLLVSMVSG